MGTRQGGLTVRDRRGQVLSAAEDVARVGHVSAVLCDSAEQVWVGHTFGTIKVLSQHRVRDRPKAELKRHNGAVTCFAALDDSVLSGGADFVILQWAAAAPHELLRQLTGSGSGVRSLAALCGAVFSASDDGTVRVWDAGTGRLAHSTPGYGVHVMAVCGGALWTGAEGGDVQVWGVGFGGALSLLAAERAHTGRVTAIAAAGARRVWTAGSDRVLCGWDASARTVLWRCPAAHDGYVTCLVPVAAQAESVDVWSCSGDRTVRRWGADELPEVLPEEVKQLRDRVAELEEEGRIAEEIREDLHSLLQQKAEEIAEADSWRTRCREAVEESQLLSERVAEAEDRAAHAAHLQIDLRAQQVRASELTARVEECEGEIADRCLRWEEERREAEAVRLRAEEDGRQQHRELAQARAHAAASEQVAAQLRAENAAAADEAAEAAARAEAAESQLTAAKAELRQLRQRHSAAAAQLPVVEADRAGLRAEVSEREAEAGELREEVAQKAAALRAAELSAGRLQRQRRQAEDELARCGAELDELRRTCEDDREVLEGQLAALRQQVADGDATQAKMRCVERDQDAAVAGLREQVAALQAKLDEDGQRAAALSAALSERDAEIDGLKLREQHDAERLSEMDAQLTAAADLQARVDELSQLLSVRGSEQQEDAAELSLRLSERAAELEAAKQEAAEARRAAAEEADDLRGRLSQQLSDAEAAQAASAEEQRAAVRELQQRVAETERELSDRCDEVEALQARLGAATSADGPAQGELHGAADRAAESLREQVSELSQLLSDRDAEVAALQRDLQGQADLRERLSELTQLLSDRDAGAAAGSADSQGQADAESLQKQVSELSQLLSDRDAEVAALQRETQGTHAAADRAVESLQERVSELSQQMSSQAHAEELAWELSSVRVEARKEVDEARAEAAALRAELERREDAEEAADLRAELTRELPERLRSVEKELQLLQQRYAQLSEAHEATESQLEAVRGAEEAARAELEAAREGDDGGLRRRCEAAEDECAELRRRCGSAEEQREEAWAEVEQLREAARAYGGMAAAADELRAKEEEAAELRQALDELQSDSALERELASERARADGLEGEAGELRRRLEMSERGGEDAEADLRAELAAALDQLRRPDGAAEQLRAELGEERSRADSLSAELAAALRSAREGREADADRAAAMAEELRVTRERTEAIAAELRQAVVERAADRALRGANDELTAELAAERQRCDALSAELSEQDADGLRRELAAEKERSGALYSELEDALARLDEAGQRDSPQGSPQGSPRHRVASLAPLQDADALPPSPSAARSPPSTAASPRLSGIGESVEIAEWRRRCSQLDAELSRAADDAREARTASLDSQRQAEDWRQIAKELTRRADAAEGEAEELKAELDDVAVEAARLRRERNEARALLDDGERGRAALQEQLEQQVRVAEEFKARSMALSLDNHSLQDRISAAGAGGDDDVAELGARLREAEAVAREATARAARLESSAAGRSASQSSEERAEELRRVADTLDVETRNLEKTAAVIGDLQAEKVQVEREFAQLERTMQQQGSPSPAESAELAELRRTFEADAAHRLDLKSRELKEGVARLRGAYSHVVALARHTDPRDGPAPPLDPDGVEQQLRDIQSASLSADVENVALRCVAKLLCDQLRERDGGGRGVPPPAASPAGTPGLDARLR